MGLAVLISTVGAVVSLVLLPVLIHSDDVCCVCLYSDVLNRDRCIHLNDCWMDWYARYALRVLWFGGWYDLQELVVLSIADEVFPVSITLVQTSVMGADCFATTSAQIVFTICMREVAGGGLVF